MEEEEKVKFRDKPFEVSEEECSHDELEFLGSEKTEGGANKYYRCLKCRAVIVVPPEGDVAYVVPGVKNEDT